MLVLLAGLLLGLRGWGLLAAELSVVAVIVIVDQSLEPKFDRWPRGAQGEEHVGGILEGLEVQPLLVFSEAWLVGRVPAQRRGVTVLPARMLAWYLSRRRPALSVEQARDLHERLAVALDQSVTRL